MPLLRFSFILLFSVLTLAAFSQEKTDANVFGHVLNASDGEHVPFINIIVEGTRLGTITDASGHYILTNLPVGSHTLVVKGMGYETTYSEIEIFANQTLEVDFEVNYTGIDLDVIVISATPTSSGFRYQPDMVYIGEKLQRKSEASFGEMLNHEPGIAMRSLGSVPARPVIRGMDGDRILILENSERMGDVSETSADHSIALDPLVASRVEVIRGPAGLLYGPSALGGVINLLTTDIPENWDDGHSGVFSLQGASMNKMGAGFGRITYGFENTAVSGRFAHRRSSDIRTPEGRLPGTSMNNFDSSLGFGFENEVSRGGASISLSGQSFEIPEKIESPDEGVEIRLQRAAIQGRLNFDDKNKFFDKKQLRFSASRLFQEEIEYMRTNGSINEDVELEYSKYGFSSTMTLQHKPVRIFDRGAFGFNIHGHRLDVGGDEAYTPGENRLNIALFTFQEIPLSNIMRLQVGLRLDFQHTGTIRNELFPDISSKRNSVNYTGSIGFNHRPLDGLEVGGQLARSHRNPSVEELFADGPHLGAGVYEVGDETINDEIGQGGDIFIKWKNDNIQFEVAGFANYFRNYIMFEPTGETDPDSGYPIFRYSGDEASISGLEISALIKLHKNFEWNLGMDFVYGRRLNNSNNYLPFMPPLRFMTGIEYDFGPGWVGGNIVSASNQNRVAPDEDVTEGYTLIGITAGYRLTTMGRHVLIFRADNLLDELYRDHLSRVEERNFPMPGRNITLAYRLFF